MADKSKITDALKQLDAGNDEHWTEGKAPAMAAVKDLAGDPSLTRADVDAAAEGFTRDTAPGFFMTAGAPAKPWESNASQKADGTTESPGVSMDADGQPQVPGESLQADGTTEPSDGAPAAEEIEEASEEAPDANAPGSEAASTAQNPPAVKALTDDLDEQEAAAVEDVGSAEPWNDITKSGVDRPVPLDSPEGQATVNDPRPEAQTLAGQLGPDAADQLPGTNADGEVSGVRIPSVTYEPRNRADVVTPGVDGDNVDVNGRPSGVPTPISDGDFSLHPPPLNPAFSDHTLPTGDFLDSPRAEGASEGGADDPSRGDGETEQSSLGGAGSGPDEVASMEEELRSVETRIADLRLTADKANKEWRDAENDADKIRNRISLNRKGNSDTETITAYLESQKQQLQRRGANRDTLANAGVDLKALQKSVSGAPIDQAMARKKGGRAAQRPTRV